MGVTPAHHDTLLANNTKYALLVWGVINLYFGWAAQHSCAWTRQVVGGQGCESSSYDGGGYSVVARTRRRG